MNPLRNILLALLALLLLTGGGTAGDLQRERSEPVETFSMTFYPMSTLAEQASLQNLELTALGKQQVLF